MSVRRSNSHSSSRKNSGKKRQVRQNSHTSSSSIPEQLNKIGIHWNDDGKIIMSRANKVPANFSSPKDSKAIKNLIALLVFIGAIVGGILLWNSDMFQEWIDGDQVEAVSNETSTSVARIDHEWVTQDGEEVYVQITYDADGNVIGREVLDNPPISPAS